MNKFSDLFDLSNITCFRSPYCHFHAPSVFNHQVSKQIYNWFSSDAPWRFAETDFYEQYEFSLMDNVLPNNLDFLKSHGSLKFIQSVMEKMFNISLAYHVEITAHKLIKGQSIRIHNDYIHSRETHRLIININPGWKDEHGGLFVICESPEPEDISKIIRPLDNSAIGFTISKQSNHAVSKVHGPDRYSLVYSFQEKLVENERRRSSQVLS